MTNYIRNKSIESNKINNIIYLKEVGKAAWNFISALYDTGWDSLVSEKYNYSFPQKVVSKFTPRIQEVKNKSKKNKPTDKPASFVKHSPLIPAKTSKEINEISKFFKRNSQPKDKSDNRKLYAQALASSTNIKEILKIKETFPNLHARKIENIQKVINNNGNLKPKLNMTMKDPLRKQAIVSISNENKIKFMESLSTHIMNFNRVLTGIKSEVMASDQEGIIIFTNKVSSPLDFQTIKKYVKNSNHINVEKVEVPCLS